MRKNVLVTISGKRLMGGHTEDIKVITPGTYARRNGVHVIRYQEMSEEDGVTAENTIVISGGCMHIRKNGLANVRMDFLNRSDRTISCYSTPYGDFVIGITTQDISIEESEDRLSINVEYALDIGDEHLSDCTICVDVASRGG